MSDARLRDLERDAARGDLQGRARLLRERVRVGDLTEARLRLAAYLGDDAARTAVADAALGVFAVTLPDEPADVTESERTHGEWARTLRALGGREALARAVVAGVRASSLWRRQQAGPSSHDRRCFERSLAALEAWVERPGEATLDRCRQHLRGADWFERAVAKLAVEGEDDLVFDVMALFGACSMGPRGRPAGVPEVQAAIAASLLPWALAPRGSPT